MAKAAWNPRGADADGRSDGGTNISDALLPSENGENYAERGIGVANAITGGRHTEKAFVSKGIRLDALEWRTLARRAWAWIVAGGDEAMIVTSAC